MKLLPVLPALLWLCLLPGRSHAAEDIQALAAHVQARTPSALELLERVVNINSGTLNFEGVREVGRVFQGEFEALGFTTEWIDGASWNRAGHLIARWEGGGTGPHLLLIGHLDTVFEPQSPFQRFQRLEGNRAAGPGVIDMKGGDVVMLLALGAVKAAGILDHLTVTVVLTGDEEKSGKPLALSRKALWDAADAADIALGFEDGDGDPQTAVIARRSAQGWMLTTTGETAHSSQVFREDIGSGAIYEAARILTRFHDELQEPNLTFNPGVILGGTTVDYDATANRGTAFGKTNVIAPTAVVAGDLRALSPEQLQSAQDAMRTIVADSLPHCTAELTFNEGYPPLAPTDGNRQLLALFNQASLDLGFGPVEPVDPARAGAADISFTAGRVDMALDGLGLMGSGGHTVEETADLAVLPLQAKRVALLLVRLSEGAP